MAHPKVLELSAQLEASSAAANKLRSVQMKLDHSSDSVVQDLGLQLSAAKDRKLKGIQVVGLADGSPAAAGGTLKTDDVIIGVNDQFLLDSSYPMVLVSHTWRARRGLSAAESNFFFERAYHWPHWRDSNTT